MTTRKPMWSAKGSSIFSERAEVLGTVSQHVHHEVVKVRKLTQSSTGRGPNLESAVDMGFVGNVRGNIRAFGAQSLKFCFLVWLARGDLPAITLCGPAVACSTCGVLPPVREQFSLCDVHSRRLRQVNDVWPLRFVGARLRVFSDTGFFFDTQELKSVSHQSLLNLTKGTRTTSRLRTRRAQRVGGPCPPHVMLSSKFNSDEATAFAAAHPSIAPTGVSRPALLDV